MVSLVLLGTATTIGLSPTRGTILSTPSREKRQAQQHFFVNPHLEAEKKEDRVRHQVENHQASLFLQQGVWRMQSLPGRENIHHVCRQEDVAEQKDRNHVEFRLFNIII